MHLANKESTKSLIVDDLANSCYFRTGVTDGHRKALIQITERCDLHCAHCFVSATKHGLDISRDDLANKIIPTLVDLDVNRITITGGEPFVHPDVVEMCDDIIRAGISVGVCTNAKSITIEQMDKLAALDDVHVNVSFDGFSRETHGRFRGNRESFDDTKSNTIELANRGLLQGILSTPNHFTTAEEFGQLAEFAYTNSAAYLLMNPLSPFGRGRKSKIKLASTDQAMLEILGELSGVQQPNFEVVPIRFPNSDGLPLGTCRAEQFLYVFANGDLSICPYLAFAARDNLGATEANKYILGNLLSGNSLDTARLTPSTVQSQRGKNGSCPSCTLESVCGKGCPAATIAAGGSISDVDSEVCAFPSSDGRTLFPVEV